MRKITAVALLLIAGCAPMRPFELPPFDAALHAPYARTGERRIDGQAFLRRRDGGVVTCAGFDVALLPDTPYYREAFFQMKVGRMPPDGSSPIDAGGYGRRTRCDAQGRFAFDKLPEARYILVAQVVWEAGRSGQGGAMLREVDTAREQVLILSDPDLLR